MEVSSACVEVPILDAVEDSEADEVDDQTGGCNDEKETGLDWFRSLDALNCFDHDPSRDAEERGTVDQRSQDLPALVSVGLAVSGGTEGDPGAEQCQTECPGIG